MYYCTECGSEMKKWDKTLYTEQKHLKPNTFQFDVYWAYAEMHYDDNRHGIANRSTSLMCKKYISSPVYAYKNVCAQHCVSFLSFALIT